MSVKRSSLKKSEWLIYVTYSWFSILRNELATALRKAPKQVNALIGGVDTLGEDVKPKIYSLDYLGSVVQVPFAAKGYAQYFVLR